MLIAFNQSSRRSLVFVFIYLSICLVLYLYYDCDGFESDEFDNLFDTELFSDTDESFNLVLPGVSNSSPSNRAGVASTSENSAVANPPSSADNANNNTNAIGTGTATSGSIRIENHHSATAKRKLSEENFNMIRISYKKVN